MNGLPLAHLLTCFSRTVEAFTVGVYPAGGTGALIACEASHMCMVARGVEKHASSTITTAARGAYLQHTALRADTLQHLMQYQDEIKSG